MTSEEFTTLVWEGAEQQMQQIEHCVLVPENGLLISAMLRLSDIQDDDDADMVRYEVHGALSYLARWVANPTDTHTDNRASSLPRRQEWEETECALEDAIAYEARYWIYNNMLTSGRDEILWPMFLVAALEPFARLARAGRATKATTIARLLMDYVKSL